MLTIELTATYHDVTHTDPAIGVFREVLHACRFRCIPPMVTQREFDAVVALVGSEFMLGRECMVLCKLPMFTVEKGELTPCPDSFRLYAINRDTYQLCQKAISAPATIGKLDNIVIG